MRMSTRLDRKAPAMSEVTIITLSLATKKKKTKKTKGEDPNAGNTQEAGLGEQKTSFI